MEKEGILTKSQQLASGLWWKVKERYPFLKQPNLTEWANDIDKLNRVDEYDWQIILLVLKWSQHDDFWRQQIRSGKALRKHFEKLLVAIKEGEVGKSRVYKV